MSRIYLPAALALAVLLSGCVGQPTADPTPQAPTASPSPTATSAPAATRPSPRFPLDCQSIDGIEALTEHLGPIGPQNSLALHAATTWQVSRLSFVEAAGGLVCEWSDGIAHQASSLASGTPGVAVEILPAAQDAWGRFATAYGLTETRSAFCNTADDPTNCGLDELIGEYWVHVDISGISRTSGDFSSLIPEAETFFTSLAGQLASLPPSQPAWQPPGEITALPSQCDAVMPADEVEQILGYSSTLSAEGPHGGWSQWADARVALGGTCGWSAGDGDASVGGIEWMSYGAWAADELLALSQTPSSPEALDLPGLGANDSAHSRCASDGSFCVIDLVVRGNWIQFDIHDPAPTQTIAVTPREGALAVAAAIVARLAG